MDVVVWLRGLGLGKYEAAFRENEIDEAVLPSLTHENLKELGVTALGHRLKLLDAIAALRANTSAKAACVHATTAPSAQRVGREDRAERRQVTVMFSDLVGWTALSARMDPEDLRDKLDALLAQSSTSIQDAALIGEMLSLPNDGRYPALDLIPEQRRQKTLEALTAQMETLSRQQPVLMIFEDAHWADPK